MNPRVVRALVVAGVLVGLVALFFGTGAMEVVAASAEAPESEISRSHMLLGLLTLGVLCMAAFGFDLRDWL